MNSPFFLDGLIIVVYFVAIVGIGLYKGRGSSDMEGFAVGDRNLPWWAVLASILAAEVSAATFLGAPGEGYSLRNFTYAQLAIGTVLARVLVSYIFIKPYYDYRVVSIYDFLRVRFGNTTKNGASFIFLFTRMLASGTRLYVGAIVLVFAYEMVAQVELQPMQEIGIYLVALVGITAITAVYTALGGIKAVVWTDVIQASIMFGAIGFAIFVLFRGVPGGWREIVAAAHNVVVDPALIKEKGLAYAQADATNVAHKALQIFDSGIDPKKSFGGNVKGILEIEYTIWAALLGSVFTTMATHGTDQDMVQRMLTAPDIKRSRRALMLSGLLDIPVVLCFLLIGLLLWVHYQDPAKKDVFAWYIVHEMPPGVRGLVVAGLFATAMGSLSTALNALATSFTEDWYVPYIKPQASSGEVVRAARWATVVFSVLLIVVGGLTAYGRIVLHLRIIPIVLGIFGYTYGSLLGVFLVGMLSKRRGSNTGNVLAMLAGFVVTALLSGLHVTIAILLGWLPDTASGKNFLPFIEVEFPWRVMIGTIVTFAVAILFRTPEKQVFEAEEHIRNASSVK